MGGLELVKDKKNGEPYPFTDRVGHRVCMRARHHGVILRSLGDVVVLMPPLAVSRAELDLLFAAVEKAIQEVTAS
jgi:adenosylmethionine-8-amino-7-oxononanoate aminotransferase